MSELAEPSQTEKASRAAAKWWRVMYARPRYEKKIDMKLREFHIESFLPLRDELRQWSDRKKMVSVPLFSGYIFVLVDERERITALEMEGALKYVGFGGKLAVVPEETIESLKIAVIRPRDIRVEDSSLKLGQKVLVRHGPFSGMRGNLVEFRGSTRVAIAVDVIHQIVSVEVPIADLVEA